jgi:hypothetical protein
MEACMNLKSLIPVSRDRSTLASPFISLRREIDRSSAKLADFASNLIQRNAERLRLLNSSRRSFSMSPVEKSNVQWQPVWVPAPFNVDVELAVLDREGAHALVFPCRRILGGWVNAATKKRLDLRPTHWREWTH